MKIDASECIPIEYIKDQIEEYRKFDHLGMYAEFLDMFIQDYKDNAMANYADHKTEPTISKMEQVEDEPRLTAKCLNCNNAKACKEKHWDGCVYEPKDEKTCETCRHWKYIAHEWQCEACKCQGYEPKDEPQTCSVNGRPYDCGNCEYFKCTADEPQTETEIAKAIVHKAIDDAVIAEDAYPDLRQKMHDAVDEYEPQTDCSWK